MKWRIATIFASCTLPLYAWAQQPNAANLKEEARNAAGIIGADKHKTRSYCQILELERQQENQKTNDHKKKKKKDQNKDKAEALSQKINQLQKQVGPEFVTLDNILKGLDYTSPDGREIASLIQNLNQSCPY